MVTYTNLSSWWKMVDCDDEDELGKLGYVNYIKIHYLFISVIRLVSSDIRTRQEIVFEHVFQNLGSHQ